MAVATEGRAPPCPPSSSCGPQLSFARGSLWAGGSRAADRSSKSDCGVCTCDILLAQHRGIVNYRGRGRTLGVRRASFVRNGRGRRMAETRITTVSWHGTKRSHGGARGVEGRNLTNDPKFEQLAGFRLLAWGSNIAAENRGASRLDKRGWNLWQKSNGSDGVMQLRGSRQSPDDQGPAGWGAQLEARLPRASNVEICLVQPLDWAGNCEQVETGVFLILVTLGNI